MLKTIVDIGNNVKLKNPIMTASGTFGYGDEFAELYDLAKLGGIVTKAITPELRVGNPLPRIAETEYGMLNSIGLANLGLDDFVSKKISFIEKFNTGGPRDRVVEKSVSNTLRVRFVDAVFPDAQYVVIVRDGRDVAASARAQWSTRSSGNSPARALSSS